MNPPRFGIIQRVATCWVRSHDRVDVQPVDGAHPLQRRLFQRGRELAAGVVHQDVETLESLADRVEEPRDLFGLAHVAGAREASLPDRLGNDRERFGSSAADRDGAARGNDRPGRGGADPGPTTGDDRDPPRERVGCQR